MEAMKTNTLLLVGCSLFFSQLTCPPSMSAMTLEEAVAKALAADPSIRKARADVNESIGFAREMKAERYPLLSFEGSIGWAARDRGFDPVTGTSGSANGESVLHRQFSLVGRQLLFDGGYSKYRYKDADERRVAEELLEVERKEITVFNTIEAYLDVISARQQITLAQDNVKAHTEILDLSKSRAEAAGNQADVDLASARRSLAETLVNERVLALRQAEARFFRWVGEKPASNLALPREPNIRSMADIDPTANWHYQAALKQKQAAVFANKAISKKYYPRFYLEVSGRLGEDIHGVEGRDNEASALLVAAWDLYDSGRRDAQVAQATADVEREQAVIDETLVALNQDIKAHWSDYTLVGERIKILKSYEGQLGDTVKLYGEQFELGTRPLLSMLDIKNEKIGAAIRLVDEERDRRLLAYRLLYFGGKLIPTTVGAQYRDNKSSVPVVTVSPKAVTPAVNPAPESKSGGLFSSKSKKKS